jgi:two-component system sensor histidine kinase RegB
MPGSIEVPIQVPEQSGAAGVPVSSAAPPAPDDRFVQLTATRAHLRFVFMARNVLLLAFCVWMVAALMEGGSWSISPWVAAIVGTAMVLNAATWLRLKHVAPVSYGEFLLQIIADVVLISGGVCLSGGDASPFEALYLLPLTVAAATLPWPHTVAVILAIVGCREFACIVSGPAIVPSAHDEEMIELLTGVSIAYFVYCLARTSRKHERFLAEIRENYLRQRHAAELGTLAAVAADQLSSPLATMAVVVGELRDGVGPPAERNQALEIVAKQIESCKQVASRMLASARNSRADGVGKVAADKFCAAIVDKCQLMQPWMTLQCDYEGGAAPAPEILAETSLEQAILVLLRSAPGAALRVEISIRWDDERLWIRLCDCAPRSPAAVDAGAGAPLFARTALAPADRLDLLMAKAAIDRCGGTLREQAQADGKACVELSLSLSAALAGNM